MDTTTQMKIIYAMIFFVFLFFGFLGEPFRQTLQRIHLQHPKVHWAGNRHFSDHDRLPDEHRRAPRVEQWLAIIGTVLLFIVNVAAGGLSNMSPVWQAAIARAHQLMPYVITMTTSALLYFLLIPN